MPTHFACILFIISVPLALTGLCPIYECVTSFGSSDTCAYRTLDYIKLKPCSSASETCSLPALLEEESACIPQPSNQKLPGEYCEDSNDCLSNSCIKQRCEGLKKGSPCKEDSQCNPGLYCANKICKETLKVGEDCANGDKCEVTAFCYQDKTCVQYASLENGLNATVPAACKSYYIHDGRCAAGPKRVGNETCSQNDTCAYYANGSVVEEMCVCGMSRNTNGYCALGRGDVEFFDYINYVGTETPKENCHILAGPLCVYKKLEDMPAKYFKAYLAYMNMTRSVMFYDNPDCVKKMVNSVYWMALEKVKKSKEVEESNSNLWIVLVIVVSVFVVALVLLCLYFKYSESPTKSETEEILTA